MFLPGVADMYPEGADTTVVPGPLGAQLEGAVRPGHFAGVLTVVAKLFHIVAPDLAYFGEKDYQQLALITRMVSVVPVPTVREPDGLALDVDPGLGPARLLVAARLGTTHLIDNIGLHL